MRTIILTFILSIIMMNNSAQETRSAAEASGLPVGVEAPAFRATAANREAFQLASALKSGPVVMIFYRGHWCPVCNKHLGAM